MDIYRDAKRRGICPPLFTDQMDIRWIKKTLLQFLLLNFSRNDVCSQNSECPRIFRVTRANQNARKLLSTALVNTKYIYIYLTIIPRAPVGYEMIDSQRGA